MKKFVFGAGLLCLAAMFMAGVCPVTLSAAENLEVEVVSAFTYLYTQPNLTSHYNFKISVGEKMQYKDDEGDFYYVSYSIKEESYDGYVPKELTTISRPSQEKILNYNGKIIKETAVYDLEGNKIENITLKPGHEIYLYSGFSSKKDMNDVQFYYEGKIVTAKVPTKNLSPNGINKGVIIALSVIAALVGIVLILLGLKKHKKKKVAQKLEN